MPPKSRRAELVSRLSAHWKLKSIGVPAFIAVFFAAYFLLLRYPMFGVATMPVTMLDEAILFQPALAAVYFSLWLYVSLAPALIGDRQKLLFHGRVATGLALAGMLIFFVWPTAIPVGFGLNDEAQAGRLSWLKQVDAGGNACPSLHVAFAVFSGWWLDRTLVEMRLPTIARLLNFLWCGAIAYSTLATKQHVAIDVLGGAVLGGLAAALGTGRADEKPQARLGAGVLAADVTDRRG